MAGETNNGTTPVPERAETKVSVSSLLDSKAEGHGNVRTWIPASVEVDAEAGEYVVRFPGKIMESNLKPSSTGKTLVATMRADFGRETQPMVVHRANGRDVVMEFGSFNISLALK